MFNPKVHGVTYFRCTPSDKIYASDDFRPKFSDKIVLSSLFSFVHDFISATRSPTIALL